MVAIIDYGVGNLFSLKCSFDAIGEKAEVVSDEQSLRHADRIILPGVGAFDDAMKKLRATGLDRVLIDEAAGGKPVLGICLGMQMLFDTSYEYGVHKGLGLIPGKIVPIRNVVPEEYKIPHIGWNALKFLKKDSLLFKNTDEGEHVYFVHSFYAADCIENTAATTEYYADLTAAVEKDNVYGTQFHPEKSGNTGLNILRAFCGLKG